MKRFEVLQALFAEAPEALLVSNLGPVSQEVYALRDAPQNFYMLGSMGLASSVGIGLALSRDRRVVVIDGDGSVLMNLGTFATMATTRPENLVHLVIDNEVHESTGSQPTHTSLGVDLANVARAAGIRSVLALDARREAGPEELRRGLRDVFGSRGPTVLVVKVEGGGIPIDVVPLDADAIRTRFMAHVGEHGLVRDSGDAAPGVSAFAHVAADLGQAGIDFACSVPCKLLAPLLPALDAQPSLTHVSVTREEEGVGICAGAYLGGRLPMLVMQNSGLGNSINALMSLTHYYSLPLLLVMGHRGLPGERIAAQVPMGERTRALLKAATIPVFDIERPEDLGSLREVVEYTKLTRQPVAALVAPSALRD